MPRFAPTDVSIVLAPSVRAPPRNPTVAPMSAALYETAQPTQKRRFEMVAMEVKPTSPNAPIKGPEMTCAHALRLFSALGIATLGPAVL